MSRHTSIARRAAQRGLTLIELLVVIVILGVLSTIVAINVLPAGDTAKVQAAQTQISILSQALRQYQLDMGQLPDEGQGLDVLVTPPSNARNAARYRPGGYLAKTEVPVDPWGNPYVYQYPGEFGEFDISSYGRDGRPGGSGPDADIGSWQ